MKQEPTGAAHRAAGGIPVIHGREDVNVWEASPYWTMYPLILGRLNIAYEKIDEEIALWEMGLRSDS